jgi:lambda family phage tail tape measure protein
LNEAQQKNVKLTPDQTAQLMALGKQMGDLEVATAKAKEQLDFSKGLFKGFVNDLASGLEQGQSFWKAFGNAALNVLDKITDKLLNDVIDALFQTKAAASGIGGGSGILGSIANGIGSLLGFGGGGFSAWDYATADLGVGLFAKGGAFANGINGYSNSIVNRPTPFMFASGAGIMGEAGPEAVMPLTRMGNGDLGVAAAMPANQNNGGGSDVGVHVTVGWSRTADGNLKPFVEDIAQQTTQTGIEQYDNRVLPHRVNQISNDPRAR